MARSSFPFEKFEAGGLFILSIPTAKDFCIHANDCIERVQNECVQNPEGRHKCKANGWWPGTTVSQRRDRKAPANRLVSMHVGQVLEVGLGFNLPRGCRQLQSPQLIAIWGGAQAEEPGDVAAALHIVCHVLPLVRHGAAHFEMLNHSHNTSRADAQHYKSASECICFTGHCCLQRRHNIQNQGCRSSHWATLGCNGLTKHQVHTSSMLLKYLERVDCMGVCIPSLERLLWSALDLCNAAVEERCSCTASCKPDCSAGSYGVPRGARGYYLPHCRSPAGGSARGQQREPSG